MFMGFGCVFNTNRVFWSVQVLYGAVNALYWKCLKRQNSTHLTPLKHQNTKTSLYKISKNQWVIMLLEIFGSVRRKLQSTVSLDHPVLHEDRNLSSKRHLLLIELMQLQLCADHIFTPRSDLYSMPGTTLHSSSA